MDDGRSQLISKSLRSYVTKRAQGKCLPDFIATDKILLHGLNTVDEKIGVRFLIQHDSNRNIPSHLILKLETVNQTDSHIMAKVNIIAQDVRVDQLPYVLLPVIS